MKTFLKPFIAEASHEILANLKKGDAPEWGLMKAQHMVEHLCWSFALSNGRIKEKVYTSGKKWPKLRNTLKTELPFTKNFKMPCLPLDKPARIKYKDIGEARKILKKEVDAFYGHYAENPEAHENHPIFGLMGKDEWELFHYKHLVHHFKQFRLM